VAGAAQEGESLSAGTIRRSEATERRELHGKQFGGNGWTSIDRGEHELPSPESRAGPCALSSNAFKVSCGSIQQLDAERATIRQRPFGRNTARLLHRLVMLISVTQA
jgi:hypothetical protein